MPHHEANPGDFDKFHSHPIFSKLSVVDRISIMAELSAEFNTVWTAGVAQGILSAAGVCLRLSNDFGDEVTDDMRRAMQAATIVLSETASKYLDECQKGASSTVFNPEDDHGH
jgi:hypothetical protein